MPFLDVQQCQSANAGKNMQVIHVCIVPGGFRADSLGFGLEFPGCPFFVRNNLAILDGAFCL
jgi:hypothetical protein